MLATSRMNDPATLPRTLHLPPAGRPRWVCPASAQLDLLYLGWGKRRFGQCPVPQSRHPGWVYFLVRTGTPQLNLGNGIWRTRPGQVLLIGPDCASGWSDSPGAVCEILTWVWRSPPRCPGYTPSGDGWRDFAADAPLQRALQHAHVLCREEVMHPSPLTKPALEHARLHIDLALARFLQPQPSAPEPAMRLEFALRWLAENPATASPVAALCQYLRISPVTLNRLFRAHLGESVTMHHARLRMERARHLLAIERLPVKEVAFALGYRHANDFSRAYKRFTGHNPGTHR